MTKINNLIFDLDNTLYDFSIIWEKSNKQVYEYLKYDRIAENDKIRMYSFDKIKMYK